MKLTEQQLIQAVDRFLGWKLPSTVCCDSCAAVPNYAYLRCGTNLLTAEEARQMLEHVLDGVTQTQDEPDPAEKYSNCEECWHEYLIEELNNGVCAGCIENIERIGICDACRGEFEKDDLTDGLCDDCYRENNSEECCACDGTGEVDSDDPDELSTSCDECGGSGRV